MMPEAEKLQTKYLVDNRTVFAAMALGETETDEELDSMNALYWYDFHARFYDSAYIRFTSIDPLCEIDPSIAPYAYCRNNPICYIDPTGLFKVSSEDAKLAPKLAHYIQNDIHKVYNNPQIRNALKNMANFRMKVY